MNNINPTSGINISRCEFESMGTEILSTIAEVDFALKHLDSWTKPVFTAYPALLAPCTSEYVYEPYGVCLIISPFNYSLNLAVRKMTPLTLHACKSIAYVLRFI